MVNNEAVNKKEFITKSICSNHTAKMQDMLSISTSALENTICCERAQNNNCVCSKCYARKQLKRYKALAAKCKANHDFYTTVKLAPEDIPAINAAFFRFESFGELQNVRQFENYNMIAKCNPQTRFTLWTKNLFIIDEFINGGQIIAPNLSIIYSVSALNVAPSDMMDYLSRHSYTEFVNAVFAVWTDEQAAADRDITINCGGNKCIECRRCYTLDHNKITFINELLK